MPGSARENDADLLAYIGDNHTRTILDVGAGSGTYQRIIGRRVTHIDAIEAWQPYVEHYALTERYRHVTVTDIRHLATAGVTYGTRYDLVIFGDILEHMSRDDALDVWTWAHAIACAGLISLPMRHWAQGPEHGNHFEAHHDDHLTGTDLLDPASPFGPFDHVWAYELTGTFIKAFS